jgi:hypothetical protein
MLKIVSVRICALVAFDKSPERVTRSPKVDATNGRLIAAMTRRSIKPDAMRRGHGAYAKSRNSGAGSS